jgi:parallel beta-helix repeat protein
MFAFNVRPARAQSEIIINPDGSISSPAGHPANISTSDNVTYTLTDNISDSIVVERDNIIIDGNGYMLQGTGVYMSEGIELSERTNVTVHDIEIQNFDYGIPLYHSSCNNISGNSITNNFEGIDIYESSNNIMVQNNMANNSRGTWLLDSLNNSIIGNNVTNNQYGIVLSYSSSNDSIIGNNVTNNQYGVYLYESINNIFYHNNFVNNYVQVSSDGMQNVWESGYPSGGNYWSDYLTRYLNATEIDDSGIGNMAYVIDVNNSDRYPFMTTYIVREFPSFLILPLFMMLTLIAVIVYRKKTFCVDVCFSILRTKMRRVFS